MCHLKVKLKLLDFVLVQLLGRVLRLQLVNPLFDADNAVSRRRYVGERHERMLDVDNRGLHLVNIVDFQLELIESTDELRSDVHDSDCDTGRRIFALVCTLAGSYSHLGGLAVLERIFFDELFEIESLHCVPRHVEHMQELLEFKIVLWALDLATHIRPLEVLDCLDDAVNILFLLIVHLLLRVER